MDTVPLLAQANWSGLSSLYSILLLIVEYYYIRLPISSLDPLTFHIKNQGKSQLRIWNAGKCTLDNMYLISNLISPLLWILSLVLEDKFKTKDHSSLPPEYRFKINTHVPTHTSMHKKISKLGMKDLGLPVTPFFLLRGSSFLPPLALLSAPVSFPPSSPPKPLVLLLCFSYQILAIASLLLGLSISPHLVKTNLGITGQFFWRYYTFAPHQMVLHWSGP